MPWQNITDIILIFSGNTSDCFVSCQQKVSPSLLRSHSPAWRWCWARSRGRCSGHTAPRSRSEAWTASPRHGPASPGQAESPPTHRTLAWAAGNWWDNESEIYKVDSSRYLHFTHLTYCIYKVNVMWKWRGKHWAHEHTSELELEVRIMRNIWKCNVMIAEKHFTFLRTQGLGKVCLFTYVLFMVNIKFFPLKVLSKNFCFELYNLNKNVVECWPDLANGSAVSTDYLFSLVTDYCRLSTASFQFPGQNNWESWSSSLLLANYILSLFN